MAMPVSTIATSASTRSSTPLIVGDGSSSRPPIRETPVGVVWEVSWMISSGTTATTFGSARSARRCALRRAWRVNPRKALGERAARPGCRRAPRCWLTTPFGSAPDRSMTMYRPVGSTPPVASPSGVRRLGVVIAVRRGGRLGAAGVGGRRSATAPRSARRGLGRGLGGLGATASARGWTRVAGGTDRLGRGRRDRGDERRGRRAGGRRTDGAMSTPVGLGHGATDRRDESARVPPSVPRRQPRANRPLVRVTVADRSRPHQTR